MLKEAEAFSLDPELAKSSPACPSPHACHLPSSEHHHQLLSLWLTHTLFPCIFSG